MEVTDVSTALAAVIFRVKRRVNVRFACICIWLVRVGDVLVIPHRLDGGDLFWGEYGAKVRIHGEKMQYGG